MKMLYEIHEKLCKELEEINRKGNLSAGDLEIVHKLTDSIKNIDKICMLEGGGQSHDGYSQDGGSYRRGYSRDGYSQAGDWEAMIHGNSYANSGQHYVRGHYSRDGSMDGGQSMDGGYSQSGNRQKKEQIEEMMSNARNERERELIKKMAQLI